MRTTLGAVLVSAGTAAGPAAAHHTDLMAFLSGGALGLSLAEHDACVFGPEGETRAFDDMDGPCRSLLEPCRSRLHLEPGAIPIDPGARALLERCLREDAGRYQVLMQRHTLEVMGALPTSAGQDERDRIRARYIDGPLDAAASAHRGCRSGVAADDTIAQLSCALAERREAVRLARQAIGEDRP